MRRVPGALQVLRVLLTCVLLGATTGAVAARPVAPMVVVVPSAGRATAAVAVRNADSGARPSLRRAPALAQPATAHPAARRARAAVVPMYLFRHALLR